MKVKNLIERTTLTLLLISVATTFTVELGKAEDPSLIEILNTLGFTHLKESTVEAFVPGNYEVKLLAEFGGYSGSNELSWYLVGTATYNMIFSGPEGNFGYINPPVTKSFTAEAKFALSLLSPEGRFFTETSKNPDALKHATVYVNLDDPDIYLIGFDDQFGAGDSDRNDMVISVKLVSATTVNINGRNWYYRNFQNTRAFIFLDGGYASYYSVTVVSWDHYLGKTKEKALFVNDMIQTGFDALINKDSLSYSGSETWAKEAAEWLWNKGYLCVFLFGYSAGGVVVGYEIQKDYASTLFSGAIVSSAPVDWDSFSPQPIYQSAHTADKVRTSTCLIEGETDSFYNQMLMYYNNMLVHKQWHTWNDGHDIFCYTCKDHATEDAQTAVRNWYNAPHPPNTPLTPSGTTSGYVYTWYTYTTCTADPNVNNVKYEFSWGDGSTNTITGWYASRATGQASHQWIRPGSYNVQVRAQDVGGAWSLWSSLLSVSFGQNDAGKGIDAGNTFADATLINDGYYYGTMYQSNPTDKQDWYKFPVQSGEYISVYMTPPPNVDFDMQLYDPAQNLRGNSKNPAGYSEYIYISSADTSGDWRIYIYTGSNDPTCEGRYSLSVYSGSGGGGGGCPILYVYSGGQYLVEGLLDIHNPDGADVVFDHTLASAPDRTKGAYRFHLMEHPKTFSHIDQVKLYAVLENGVVIEQPLTWAWHSEYGNVLPQIRFSDDWKTETKGEDHNNGIGQSIELRFAAVSGPFNPVTFIFAIEGNNAYMK